MKIIVSTDNKNKIREINEILGSRYSLISKSQAGYGDLEIIEDGLSLEENAFKKVINFKDLSDIVIGDDTGLFVESLGGQPGIYSARFAGEDSNDASNRKKLLKLLEKEWNRKAYFKTVIAIKEKDEVTFVEGICEGKISTIEKGSLGFGYDNVFIPNGYTETFSEMSVDLKNKISHRAKALENLEKYLKENYKNI